MRLKVSDGVLDAYPHVNHDGVRVYKIKENLYLHVECDKSAALCRFDCYNEVTNSGDYHPLEDDDGFELLNLLGIQSC